LVKSFREEYRANQSNNTAHNKRQLFWTKISAGLLLGYVGLTFWQACSAQQSLNTIKNQFQLETRPYISITGFQWLDTGTGNTADAVKSPIIGKPLAITVGFVNVGKSVAANLVVHRHVLFGTHTIEAKVEPVDEDHIDSTLDPGKGNHTTAISIKDTYSNESAIIDRNEVVNWDGSWPIIVFGRITYEDSFGNKYCTPYFSEFLQTGDWLVGSGVRGTSIQKATDLCPLGKAIIMKGD
jgi:hypothetical protein